MSMQDLPVGRRRGDYPEVVQPVGMTQAPPWDTVLERLANLERSHAELARLVTSIHEALPPEIAAATGRSLALGSPIDTLAPPVHSPAPIVSIVPPPLPPPVMPPPVMPPIAEAIDPFTQTYEAPDPWASPNVAAGDAFFRPLDAMSAPTAADDRPKRRLFRSRRAAREAQARIAAEFAMMNPAPPPPPGFMHENAGPSLAPPPPPPGFLSGNGDHAEVPPPVWDSIPAVPTPASFEAAVAPPPPPPGFGTDVQPPSAAGWGSAPPPPPPGFGTDVQPPSAAGWGSAPPPPPPGFGNDFPQAGLAPPPGWSAAGPDSNGSPVSLHGFSADIAEPMMPLERPPLAWGTPVELESPSDFVFDQPSTPQFDVFGDVPSATPPPPPAGFGSTGSDTPPPPPPGFAAEFASNGAERPGMDITGKVPVIGSMAPDPDPSLIPPPPPGFGSATANQGAVPPPPGFGQGRTVHDSEVFGDVQDVTSLVVPPPPPEHHHQQAEEMDLLGTGTEPVAYGTTAPPVTPDFFARSAGKGRR